MGGWSETGGESVCEGSVVSGSKWPQRVGGGAVRQALVTCVPPVLVVCDWCLVREGEAVVVCLKGFSCVLGEEVVPSYEEGVGPV